jgi:hypothetical protein
MPVEVVRDPAAEGRSDGGGYNDGHPIDRESLASFFDWEGIGEDSLFAGGETSASGTLQNAREDEQGQCVRDAAKKGADGKQSDANHVETFAAEAIGEPARDGQDDGAGDEIAGENPGGFFRAGAEGTCDVGKGDVSDGGVENLHESGKRDGKSDGPRIVVRLPDGGRAHCHRCHISLLI